MLTLTLLTIGLFAQGGTVDKPTMQFTNNTSGPITVWIYSRDNRSWENDKRPLTIRARATASISLREGNFQVVARNTDGHEDRNNRILAPRELDWMDFNAIYGRAEPGVRLPKTMFKIMEHEEDRR